jgi:hypothetical protein
MQISYILLYKRQLEIYVAFHTLILAGGIQIINFKT